MLQIEKKYEQYIRQFDVYAESEDKHHTLAEEVTSTERNLKSLQEQLHTLERNHTSDFTDSVHKEVENELQKLEKQYAGKLQETEQQMASAYSRQTENERQYFSELEKNKQFFHKMQAYKDKVDKDVANLCYLFPDIDVESVFESRSVIGYNINDLSSSVPKDIEINEGSKRYYDISRLNALKYIFAPMLYKEEVVSKKTLYLYSSLSLAALIGMFFTKFPIGLEISCVGVLIIILSSMLHSKHNSYFNAFTTFEARNFYHFVLHGESLIEDYTKAKLGITTKTMGKLEEDYRASMTRLKSELKQTVSDIETSQAKNRELASVLDSMKDQRRYIRGEKQLKSFESRYQSKLNQYNKLGKKIQNLISRESSLKAELKGTEDQFNKDSGQLKTLSELESLIAIKNKVLLEKEEAQQKLRNSIHEQVENRLSNAHKKNKAALKKEIDSLTNRLNKQTEALGSHSAEVAAAKETCSKLAAEFVGNYPTISETEGVLSQSTYVMSKHTISEGLTKFSQIEHHYRPSIMLYKLDESVSNVGNVTAQLEGLLRQIIEGFFRTNAFNSIQQSLVDTITGSKVFQSQEYSAILKVYEKHTQLKELVDQLEDVAKKVVSSQSGTIAEANKLRVEEKDPPIKYQIVYFIMPPADSNLNPNIVNEDIWRLMHDGHKYGFLPIFFIKEAEWSSFVHEDKQARNNTFAQLKNVVGPENIYQVDLVQCTIEAYKEEKKPNGGNEHE